MKKTVSITLLIIISAGLFIVGIFYCRQGFDKKDNYYNSEYSWSSTNAYVGGDAYNYIINGTYFAGYCTLGGALIVCGTICGVAGIEILCQDDTTYLNYSSAITETRAESEQTKVSSEKEDV